MNSIKGSADSGKTMILLLGSLDKFELWSLNKENFLNECQLKALKAKEWATFIFLLASFFFKGAALTL